MNLQHALECITNSTAINKLDASIRLNDNITSSDIKWSKFGKLDIKGWSDTGNLSIDEISDFDGELETRSVNINSLSGDLKSLTASSGSNTSIIKFESDTTIEELTFHTGCLDRLNIDDPSPYINKVNLFDYFYEGTMGNVTPNLRGFLSKANIISRSECKDTVKHQFKPLGYLTIDNEHNEIWPKVTLEKTSVEKPVFGFNKSYVIPTEFYDNLIFYVSDGFPDYNSNCFTLDYVNGFIDDTDETNIVIPHAGALKAYLPDEVPELPVILGDYCFGGIGSKPASEKDRHLYLTFDDNFIFNTDIDSPPRDDGAAAEIKESSRPFTENTFIARPGAIQKIYINLPERRGDDTNPEVLYFSDFFTTVEKLTITDAEGAENITYNFNIDEDVFTSYKNKLLSMVDGDESKLIFNSPYEEIEAIIEVE